MTKDDFMKEACRLAKQSVENGWGGPFGAVIVQDGEIIARGQNRVLLTGDITAHAEIETIRKACQVINPFGPSISEQEQNESILGFVDRPEDSCDVVPQRSRMLMGMELYVSGAPCPMCMSAIYWARLDAAYFSCTLEDTSRIGFDDAFQYEDFVKPYEERRIKIQQLRPDLGAEAYEAWMAKENRHYY